MRTPSGDRGETLVELMVTMMIMGIAVVTLIGGLGTAIRLSDIHRQQAVTGAYLRDLAETIQTAVARSPSLYQDCANRDRYRTEYVSPDPAKYTPDVLTVRYWDANSSTFSTTCGTDTGIQLLSLEVRSGDASETLELIIRKPCRLNADFPLDPACA